MANEIKFHSAMASWGLVSNIKKYLKWNDPVESTNLSGAVARIFQAEQISTVKPVYNDHPIRPFTECLLHAHPVHSDFRLSKPVDYYVNNLENGVILSYINDEIKIVAIQKSVLYNDGNLVIILSAFFSPENDRRKKKAVFANVIYSTIWLPPKRGSCHLVIPTGLYPFTFADIVVD